MPVAGGENSAKSSECGWGNRKVHFPRRFIISRLVARAICDVDRGVRGGILIIQIGPKQENPDLGSGSHPPGGRSPFFRGKLCNCSWGHGEAEWRRRWHLCVQYWFFPPEHLPRGEVSGRRRRWPLPSPNGMPQHRFGRGEIWKQQTEQPGAKFSVTSTKKWKDFTFYRNLNEVAACCNLVQWGPHGVESRARNMTNEGGKEFPPLCVFSCLCCTRSKVRLGQCFAS